MLDVDTANPTEPQVGSEHHPQKEKGKRSEPKAPFDAERHGKTMEAIKGIPADRRNAVRDEAIRRVLRSDMPASYKVVFVKLILDIWWKDGACLLSNREFTVECGGDTEKSRWVVRRAFAELCKRGLVSRRMRPAKAGDLQTAETTVPLLAQVWAEMQEQRSEGVGAPAHLGSVTSAPHFSVLSLWSEQVDRHVESQEGYYAPHASREDAPPLSNDASEEMVVEDKLSPAELNFMAQTRLLTWTEENALTAAVFDGEPEPAHFDAVAALATDHELRELLRVAGAGRVGRKLLTPVGLHAARWLIAQLVKDAADGQEPIPPRRALEALLTPWWSVSGAAMASG